MKRNILAGVIAAVGANMALAGEAVFYITEQGQPVDTLSVTVNGDRKLVGKNGFVSFDLGSGTHQIELSEYGQWAGEFSFDADAAENAEIQIEMIAGEAVPEIAVYTPGQEEQAVTGKVAGYIESDETGGGVQGATISISNTDIVMTTDSNGYYEIDLPRGEYDFSISHPTYGSKKLRQVRVIGNYATALNTNMSMNGNSAIEEVVAVGSYIPSTATVQQRDSSAVLNAIGSEQLARFGDSNAASALKRVAGVSVSGGKYVVSRGLNERHSTIMLNGASLPSPDPSRRVVPLDIFPSTMIDGIEVQKSFTPNVYADSTGAAVRLETKKFPMQFEGKISGSIGYVSGLTFNDRNVQQSENLDLLGFGINGDRALPSSFNQLDETFPKSTPIATDFADNLSTENTSILPNASFEVSMGDTLLDNGSSTVGYTASLKYSNDWSYQDREQNSYLGVEGSLTQDDDYLQERTSNDVNLGAGLSIGWIYGNSEFASNTMVLRQTHTENVVETGIGGDQNRESIGYTLGWYERMFTFQQFTGDHYLPLFQETEMDWQVSFSQASLEAPDERSYSFEKDQSESEDEYVLYWSSLDRVYNELTDDNIDFSIDFKSMVFEGENFGANLKYGASIFSRSRTADGTTVNYSGNGQTANGFEGNLDIDDVVAQNLANGVAGVIVGSRPSDDYDATWDMTSYYLNTDLNWYENLKLSIGARAEDSDMKLETFTVGSTSSSLVEDNAEILDDDIFLSTSLVYYITEEIQVRGAYYDTINRPDFREISNSFYVDPDSGDTFVGNPRLESTQVSNQDLRIEYYFSDLESVSLAYFTKDFDQPIEKTLKTGGDVFTYSNAQSGELSGFEFDFRKEFDLENYTAFISGNYAVIDSEVEVVVGSTLRSQAMQGQPEDLANVQLGFDDLGRGSKYTLLVNYKGESLDSFSVGGTPNVIKAGRTQLDFNYSQELSMDLSIKAKIKNITDAEHLLEQGGRVFRRYKDGVEFSVGLSINL